MEGKKEETMTRDDAFKKFFFFSFLWVFFFKLRNSHHCLYADGNDLLEKKINGDSGKKD